MALSTRRVWVTRAVDRESPWRCRSSLGNMVRKPSPGRITMRVALRAAEALLDRAYGQPPQAIAVQAQRPLQIIITDAITSPVCTPTPIAQNRLLSSSSLTRSEAPTKVVIR